MSSSSSSQPPARRPLVGTSLKMYFSPSRTAAYLDSVVPLGALASSLGIDAFVIPDFLAIASASASLASSPVLLGAQDCCWENEGAFTGEVSPKHLKELGVHFVELGHAERRRYLGETDALVARKAGAACRNGLVPLVCIGEKEDKGVDAAVEECRPQVESLLAAVPPDAEVVLAYEPVWAIGQPKPAGAAYVVAVTKRLRAMAEQFEGADGRPRTGLVRILYGGSAGPGLFAHLREGVDGLFLGRFAHDVANLEQVMREVGARP